MSSLFIIGNGFDLAHGLPSKYSDFKRSVTDNYPEAEGHSNEQFDMYDYIDMSEDEFSAELLLYAINNACGPAWNDFEDALGRFHFRDKFPRRSKESQIVDDDRDIQDYLLAIDIISTLIIRSTRHWQDFFTRWIRSVELVLEHGIYQPKSTLSNLFAKSDNLYLTFNYTKTLQHLYGIKKVIHIHNRVGQQLIFGHGDDKATYQESSTNGSISSSFLEELVLSFRKDTASPMRKYSAFFRGLNMNIDKVYSYGFSYSKVDSIYIKAIIENISEDAVWHFTEYEEKDREPARIKKVKLRRYGFKGSFEVFSG